MIKITKYYHIHRGKGKPCQARSQEFLRGGGANFFEKRDLPKKFLFSKKNVIEKIDDVFFLEKRNFSGKSFSFLKNKNSSKKLITFFF